MVLGLSESRSKNFGGEGMIQARVKGDGCEIQIQGNADTMRQEFMGIVRGMHGALAEHTGSDATATTLLLSLFTAGVIECMDSDGKEEDDDYEPEMMKRQREADDAMLDMIKEAIKKEYEGE